MTSVYIINENSHKCSLTQNCSKIRNSGNFFDSKSMKEKEENNSKEPARATKSVAKTIMQ